MGIKPESYSRNHLKDRKAEILGKKKVNGGVGYVLHTDTDKIETLIRQNNKIQQLKGNERK